MSQPNGKFKQQNYLVALNLHLTLDALCIDVPNMSSSRNHLYELTGSVLDKGTVNCRCSQTAVISKDCVYYTVFAVLF